MSTPLAQRPPDLPNGLKVLNELYLDAKLGKGKHFNAARRKERYHKAAGIAAIVINVLLGSGLIAVVGGQTAGALTKIAAALLSFGAATLSGLQTIFNFNKEAEGHRSVGNRYLALSRACKIEIAEISDSTAGGVIITADALYEKIRQIQNQYDAINRDAEAFSTSTADLSRARGEKPITPFVSE